MSLFVGAASHFTSHKLDGRIKRVPEDTEMDVDTQDSDTSGSRDQSQEVTSRGSVSAAAAVVMLETSDLQVK